MPKTKQSLLCNLTLEVNLTTSAHSNTRKKWISISGQSSRNRDYSNAWIPGSRDHLGAGGGGGLFVCFLPCCVAWGILVSRLSPALEAWSLTTEPPGKFHWGNILEVVNISFAKPPLMLTSYPNITTVKHLPKLKNSPPYKIIIKCVDQFGFHLVFPRMNLFCFRSIPPSHFAFSCSL